jgi:hypothetical protein
MKGYEACAIISTYAVFWIGAELVVLSIRKELRANFSLSF